MILIGLNPFISNNSLYFLYELGLGYSVKKTTWAKPTWSKVAGSFVHGHKLLDHEFSTSRTRIINFPSQILRRDICSHNL
jgi:hypothetical protein